ncbi:LOW QUALITY PROTEIN: trichohyalin [Drosophila sulfurigaster albostrigata]|uniref:LOW QUALITY PROTEIN: trichohyalin n=1 Tax=Drosophila sulfurigaster albostrigata TaxID=89887 RepID=UPI002D218589|nr:LOW QUALITY PROTEIN: trichohyalin [Drosophila sulfurigaster albostrigata]
MTPKKKRRALGRGKSRAQTEAEHQQLLEALELADSCCDICHCDCYSSHSSSSHASGRGQPATLTETAQLQQLEQEIQVLEQLQRSESAQKKRRCHSSQSRQRSASKSPTEAKAAHSRRGSADCQARSSSGRSKRSKSAGSQRSQSRQEEPKPKHPKRHSRRAAGQRDCQMLQLIFDDASTLAINGRGKSKSQENMALVPLPQSNAKLGRNGNTLCASMANLCLAPTVRAAYAQVPSHDQKILNRMAVKRSQQAADKEHAWLARKFWENERLERQLLKCEQLEEYKRAVHDKQFQDYLLTKARLQALAERDLAELRRLRGALDAKDEAAKERLKAMRLERDLTLCQRRYEESRRNEAVTLQQEEQQLDATLRKRDICMRLTQRLRRADELRNQLLEGYLKRLQHDNQVEQLQHEEHWRERQQLERLKREQLQCDIQKKRQQSQRFEDCRQRRHEARFRTAKISASLRELVRQSVTPETGLEPQANSFYAQQQSQLGRLLFKQQPTKQLDKLN